MKTRFAAAARGVAELWSGEFCKVMEAMADLRPDVELKSEAVGAPAPNLLWWKQPFDLADGALLWVGVAEEAWRRLGEQILTAAGIESAEPQEARSTFLEVLRQSLGSLATCLTAQVGREVLATEGSEEAPAIENAEEFRLALRAGAAELPEIVLVIAEPVADALSHRYETRSETPRQPEPQETGCDDPPRASGTLDVLLEVEMPVSVSFGKTQLRLQDVLKLISGSIIELDRAISEPVEVIVNNCVIARGEVVVVEGNYGVRIQEIMSRRERLQQSRRYMLPAHGHRN